MEATDIERLTDVGTIRNHIEAKFAAARVENSPYPHLIIEDFWPGDVFEKLIEWNPFKQNAGSRWMDEKESRNVSARTPYHARKQINFHADEPFDAPQEQLEFWNAIKELFLGDDWFPRLVLEKFPLIFQYRFGDLTEEDDFFNLFYREFFLQRHEPGYEIGPHTDIPSRVFTCIFSLAREEGWEEYGTELLRPKDRLDRCWGNDHYDYEKFEIAKIAPYKPNNFLLFHKTRHSFHSVRSITPDVPDERYGMQFQFYEPYGGLFNDLSAPDLMHVVRRDTTEPGKTKLSKIKRIVRQAIPS
jgi:hypothetical protein